MKTKVLKSVIILISIVLTMLIMSTVSNAALSISTSKSTVAPGESFNVTVSVSSSEAGAINLSVSNGTLSQTYIDLMSQSSLTVSCVAGSSGTVSLNASGLVANYNTLAEETQYASKSVTIKQPEPEPAPPPVENKPTTNENTNTGSSNTSTPKPETPKPEVKKSSNSKLDSLQIAEGAIAPEFSSSVKEYSISIPNEITKLSISAIADHSKATVRITGNEDLQVGDNTISVTVTAEDGSKTTYTILAKRAQPELCLQTLNVSYINENGEKVDLILNPQFTFNIYEYSLDEILAHTIEKLEVVAIANRENAVIEVLGNEELKTGKNEIVVKVTITDEAGLEEQKTYKISLEKQAEPVVVPETTISKISNFFGGIGTGISKWVSDNFNRIITGMLLIATAAFAGLTVYFVYDYKNYKKVLMKLAELNKSNLMERANVALDPEMAKSYEEEPLSKIEEATQIEMPIEKKSKGRRFK